MSILAKIFETEEVIEVRQVRVKKYKVNWKRLFSNFVSIFMFWKKKDEKPKTVQILNPNDLDTPTSREHLLQMIKENSVNIPGMNTEQSFRFTKELAEWTAQNTLVRDGFGSEGNQKESIEKAKEIRKQQEENKR